MATYSQEEEIASGHIPTWNSPDILTNWWSPWRLMQEAKVKVRNLSTVASAVNAQVNFYVSPFGIGMQRTLESTKFVNLGPGQEVELLFPLSQYVLQQIARIGTYAESLHPHDQVRINNRGSQVIDGVFTSEAGRNLTFQFPVLNQSTIARQITLSVLANDLSAVVNPTVRNFAPWEQIQATLSLQVPMTLHGSPGADIRREATVIGRGPDGSVIDGLTYIIRIDN